MSELPRRLKRFWRRLRGKQRTVVVTVTVDTSQAVREIKAAQRALDNVARRKGYR